MTPVCTGVMVLGSFWPAPAFAAVCALVGAAIPVIINSAFLSRKDRKGEDQTLFENLRGLLDTQTGRRNDFTAALAKAVKKTKPSIDDIHSIMKTGEAYFETMRLMAQSILDGRVSDNVRDRDFVPTISEALLKNIPQYYDALKAVCSKYGLPFDGTFKESNYESLFSVADQFDHATWIEVRRRMELTT